jgi:hypothetical protein
METMGTQWPQRAGRAGGVEASVRGESVPTAWASFRVEAVGETREAADGKFAVGGEKTSCDDAILPLVGCAEVGMEMMVVVCRRDGVEGAKGKSERGFDERCLHAA